MEESKPSISFRVDDGGAMEGRFVDLCKNGVGWDESTTRHAVVLYRESKHILLASMSSIGSGSAEEIERIWSAFVLYCVTRLSKGRKQEDEKGITLCQILRALKVNVVDFFKEMPRFYLKVRYILVSLYGSDWEKRLELKELHADTVHLRALSRYYRQAYQEFFMPSQSSGQHSAFCNSKGYISDYHRFGWLLFLALHVHAFSQFKDLVTCTNGLVSIMAILVLHVPVRLRTFTTQTAPRFAKKSNKGVNLLASLCDMFHTSEDELKRTLEQTNTLIVDILKKKPRPAAQCKSETLHHVDTDNLTYFEDLLEESSLQSSLAILEKHYDEAIYAKDIIDERLFVNDEDSLLGGGSLSGNAIHICGTKRRFDEIASLTKTISSSLSPPRTPSSTMNASIIAEKWSSMYNSLIIARPTLAAEINPLGLLAEPMPSLDAISTHYNIPNGNLSPLPFQKRETSTEQNGDASLKAVNNEQRSVLVECKSFTSPVKERLMSFNSLKSKLPPLQSAFASQKTCILGEKRVVAVSSMIEESDFASPVSTKVRKRFNHLEALPQDILVRILCGVSHSDLRQLLLVSKAVQEATLIAKELHFAFCTPSKPKIRGNSDFGGGVDTPNAPKRSRIAKSRLNDNKLASIGVTLFVTPEA